MKNTKASVSREAKNIKMQWDCLMIDIEHQLNELDNLSKTLKSEYLAGKRVFEENRKNKDNAISVWSEGGNKTSFIW